MRKFSTQLITKLIVVLALLVGMQGNAQSKDYSATAKTWTGANSTDWYNSGNWSGGVPSSTDDVIIPVGMPRYPSLPSGSTTTCNNLSLNPVGTYNINGGNLVIFGALNISGALIIKFPTMMTVKSGGMVTVAGALTIYSPNGVENSRLVIETNGSFIPNCDNISYKAYNSPPYSGTGYPVVYRTIIQDLKWHLLSSPVMNQAIANKDFAPAPNNFLLVPNTAWDFYKWLTTCPDPPYDNNWRNLRNPDGTQNYVDFGYPSYFETGRGYLVAYNNWHENNQVFVNNQNKLFYGPLNKCCQVFDFHNDVSLCNSFWELIGNPYPSAIDWSQVTDKENLASSYYYIYNNDKAGGEGYEFWSDADHHTDGTDGYIAAMQGFFVSVQTNGDRVIGLPLGARVHHVSTDTWLKDTPANRLTLRIGDGSKYDEAFIMFEANGLAGRDRNDAEKMFSMNKEVPQLYSLVDNSMKTAMNSLPYSSGPVTIPLGIITPVAGEYTLSIDGLTTFTSLSSVLIEDVKLNTSQNLLENPVYTFTGEGNEDAGRFLLHLNGPIGISDKHNDNQVSIYSTGKVICINVAEGAHNGHITLTNMLGQEIMTTRLGNQKLNQVRADVQEGYYIVKFQDDANVQTARVFIK